MTFLIPIFPLLFRNIQVSILMWKSCWKRSKKKAKPQRSSCLICLSLLCVTEEWYAPNTFYTVRFMWCRLFFFHLRKLKPTVEKGTKPISSTDELLRFFFLGKITPISTEGKSYAGNNWYTEKICLFSSETTSVFSLMIFFFLLLLWVKLSGEEEIANYFVPRLKKKLIWKNK